MNAALLDRLHGQSVWWPRLALLLAACLLLWLSVRMFWLLVAGPDLPPPPPVSPSAVQADGRPTASIAQWRLFGNAAPGIDPRALAAQAPETALRLTLRGTLSEQSPEGGIAIIADEQGVDRAYRVGDALPGGARLEAIHAGRVLLSRDGVNEALSLPRTASAAEPARQTATATASGRPPPPVLGGGGSAFVSPVINTGAPQLQTQRALAGVDLERLSREVSVIPVLENGRMAGVRLSVGRDSDLLSRSGLRRSDVVTAVNGIPLDGPQRQAELLSSLRDARQVTLTVRRDGQTLDVPVGF
jgi:general secretion pathway protein C